MKKLKIFLSLLAATTALMVTSAVTPAAESYPPTPMNPIAQISNE